MFNIMELLTALLLSFAATFGLVYPVKSWAVKIGAIDLPAYRKVHKKAMPRLGGLAIFLGTTIGLLYLQPSHEFLPAIIAGALVIIVTGILDDKYQLRPLVKLTGQIMAAGIVIFAGLIIERVTLPLFGLVELGFFSVIVTFFWIIGIINAINLIDGLDGLASGVSTIAFISILVMAVIDQRSAVVFICIALIGSNIGFLFHNFHPASIYMGDTGSMFLGYSIAVISILGLFKNVAFFSFVIPVILLAVPIFDTLFAIVRRWLNSESIMAPDKKHIHYKLLDAGFSHVTTVLIIYSFSACFGALAIIFSNSSSTVSFVITLIFLLLLHIFAEIVGIVGNEKKPVLKMLGKVKKKSDKEKKEEAGK